MGGVVVLLPVYNAATFLEGALESLTKQASCGLTVAAVDDASIDGSFHILQDFARTSPFQIAVAQNGRNVGMAANWNACIDLAHREFDGAEFTLKLDADDRLSAGAIESLVYSLRAESRAVLAFCRTRITRRYGAAGEKNGLFARLSQDGVLKSTRRYFSSREMLYLMLRYDNLLPSSGTMWRVGRGGDGDRFNTEFRWAADYEFWTRLLQRGGAVFCPKCSLEYFVHGGSITGTIGAFERALEVARVGALRVRDSAAVLGPSRTMVVVGTLIRRAAALGLLRLQGSKKVGAK